jgi:hypothetical protein
MHTPPHRVMGIIGWIIVIVVVVVLLSWIGLIH